MRRNPFPSRITFPTFRFCQLLPWVIEVWRPSSSSTQTRSGLSSMMAWRTSSTLSRETCAVPRSTISLPPTDSLTMSFSMYHTFPGR